MHSYNCGLCHDPFVYLLIELGLSLSCIIIWFSWCIGYSFVVLNDLKSFSCNSLHSLWEGLLLNQKATVILLIFILLFSSLWKCLADVKNGNITVSDYIMSEIWTNLPINMPFLKSRKWTIIQKRIKCWIPCSNLQNEKCQNLF